MRVIFLIVLCTITFLTNGKSLADSGIGYVPDEKTAVKIAKDVCFDGNDTRLSATLTKGVWSVVHHRAECPKGMDCNGGTAICEINQKDGSKLRIMYGI